ncbi:Pimeloyl-ACP methyl ester carboxylesterase [Pseudomonas koreensis]|uniref:alpha/beta fold hydrolase n=1 Tax=Pseudomonas koreensis TaxID=198620 RepID=UPI00087B8DA3|nr:alpha/beta hydrolase [Pseudomonas koreensis]KAB0516227.1 alpha/beta hydrolase [Pseudomonas koreensis]NNA60316.1 alpha/beta hydrolase [Pseudomonas koreensis]GGK18495.1 epoxide hydrolase [Pseudomonas koreensis]SDD11453.1 Pimeloyl-ACP methyl ester carboxylesterase [Pseudomonas koreensis]
MPLAEIPLCVWRKHSRTFVFRGHSIRYWTAGQGEPLLLIHGFPTASWDWHYLWQPLAQRYRVIACDMLGFGDSAKPLNHSYSLLEQADLQQALLADLQVEQPIHVLAHDYGDSVAQELLARHYEQRIEVASCVFLNGGLFPETHRPVLMQKLLLSPLGWMIGRAFNRDGLVKSFRHIFGPQTGPSESELDDFWSLIETHRGPRIMHKLIGYIPERRVQRDRWVAAMQRDEVPLRVIDGEVDPISGAHMVERYRQLIADADTVLLPGIGHYPQIEAPVQVLKHYLAFRDRLALPPRKVACS